MESSFSMFIPIRTPISRDDIIFLDHTLHSIISTECNCQNSEVTSAIRLFTDQHDHTFNSVQEFTSQIAPLDEFKRCFMTAFYNPLQINKNLPAASISINIEKGDTRLWLSASSTSHVRAQEIALHTKNALAPLCPTSSEEISAQGQDQEDRNAEVADKDGKPRKKIPFGRIAAVLLFLFALISALADLSGCLDALIGILTRIRAAIN